MTPRMWHPRRLRPPTGEGEDEGDTDRATDQGMAGVGVMAGEETKAGAVVVVVVKA